MESGKHPQKGPKITVIFFLNWVLDTGVSVHCIIILYIAYIL